MNSKIIPLKRIFVAIIFLILSWIMPFLTLEIPKFGNMLCPMHIPIILSGFVLGPIPGLILGFIAPLTRTLFFGVPSVYPTSVCMSIELASYGFISGILFKVLMKHKFNEKIGVYLSLVSAMILGRCLWGISMYFSSYISQSDFTFSLFIENAFINAFPGIIVQLVFIPLLVLFLLNKGIINKCNYELE